MVNALEAIRKHCIDGYLFCVIAILSLLVVPAVCEQTKGGHATSDGVYQANPESAAKFAVSFFIIQMQYKFVLNFWTKY